ncbi:hypothetical protein BUALT_Bualt11G0074200 [Buddleja alternifolia]|uniref:Cytochrome P450 n=1 Tax=Buddleja alternifolia TaxID=168488 RepID=A0AAV6WUK6_9LAMI|nr:hypothetical protein BUALT_Bualt11G0074200 [Buddleja alternifolia]
MDLFYVYLFSLIVFLVSLSIHFLFYKNKSTYGAVCLPPGKTGWPFFGESLEFITTNRKGHAEKFILDRVAKYASHVFKTHLFGAQTAVFCGPKENKFLFSNENKLVQVWLPSSVTKVIFTSAVDSSPGEEALKIRNMLPNVLKPENLQRYVSIIDHIAQKHFAEKCESKKEILVYPLARRYTFWVACKVFISMEDPNDVAKFTEHFDALISGLFSIPINFPGTNYNKAIKASKFIRKHFLETIKQRKIDLAEGKASPTQDMLSHMLLMSDENGKFMHELDIANKILGLLIGGYDSSSSACTFIVKYLAELPEIYAEVYKEFFPEPQKFDPSRFEGFGPAPYTFVPFGGGPRMCPGKEYARLIILVFMHHIVKRFKWEKIIPDEKIVVDPMPFPAKGLPIRLYPH